MCYFKDVGQLLSSLGMDIYIGIFLNWKYNERKYVLNAFADIQHVKLAFY